MGTSFSTVLVFRSLRDLLSANSVNLPATEDPYFVDEVLKSDNLEAKLESRDLRNVDEQTLLVDD